MKIAVITNEPGSNELLAQMKETGPAITWLSAPQPVQGIFAYIDLMFEPSNQRIKQLKNLPQIPVIINDVAGTLDDLPENFIRINGWNSFLKRPVTEAAAKSDSFYSQAEKVFTALGKKLIRVPDLPGFAAARVVSMIINEAWLSLEEGVSAKDAIDTAMKLGTNYPYGPFEWGDIIGLKNICTLLFKMAEKNKRYIPCSLLQKEALTA